MSKLTFFFDAISPYSMLMFNSLLRYRREWGTDVECKFVPVLLAGVMQGSENKPPGLNKLKGRYMAGDLKMTAEMSGVKLLRMPRNFFEQAQDMRVMRLLASIEMTEERDVQEAAIQRAFAAIHADPGFRDDANKISISDDALLDLCLSAGVANPQETLASLSTPPVKDHLKANTSQAVSLGMFGAPFIHATSSAGITHTFFGSDRLEHLCHFLGKPYHGLGHKL
eukprot:TRINITY_DN9908_c0_g1_i1.p1 TRINITY_DN9908_c0_g1~~TRINITY_DN9908_c0_g1_i1.p1  ORF type:complete len:225 (+),score=59.25 TRINITY_DN9908_c0_g1_i1:48-722(+)